MRAVVISRAGIYPLNAILNISGEYDYLNEDNIGFFQDRLENILTSITGTLTFDVKDIETFINYFSSINFNITNGQKMKISYILEIISYPFYYNILLDEPKKDITPLTDTFLRDDTRLKNCLRRVNIESVEDLVRYCKVDKKDLIDIRGISVNYSNMLTRLVDLYTKYYPLPKAIEKKPETVQKDNNINNSKEDYYLEMKKVYHNFMYNLLEICTSEKDGELSINISKEEARILYDYLSKSNINN